LVHSSFYEVILSQEQEFTAGSTSSLVGELPGLLGSLLACQPHNPTSSLHTFLQCDARQHSGQGRDDTEKFCSDVKSPISTPCWEADSHISLLLLCCIPCFFHFYLLAGTAVEDWIHLYPRPRC